jgi:hypothetical protein
VAFIALIATAVLGACGDSGPTEPAGSPSDPVAGTFALTTVNAEGLPFSVFNDAGYKLEITKGTVALDTAGTFIISTTTRETVAGNVSVYADTARGTWTQNEGAVALTIAPGGPTGNAEWDGRRLTLVETDGISSTTYVYTKNR